MTNNVLTNLSFDEIIIAKRWTQLKKTNGSVLILVLWTLFFLTSLAVTTGIYVSAGLTIAREIKARTSARFLALAGVKRAIMEVMHDTNWWDGLEETWSRGVSVNDDWNVENGFYIVYASSDAQNRNLNSIQKNEFLGLEDEEKRVNINTAPNGLLSALIEIVCGVNSMVASEIAASIVDWRDEDDIVTPGGAENAFYLRNGYPCANEAFRSVYELLLVKGITPEIYEQLVPFVTIWGTGKINLNTADKKVLQAAIYSCSSIARAECEAVADKIVKLRETGNAFDSSNASLIVKRLEENYKLSSDEKSVLVSFLTSGLATVKSTCFRGIAAGLSGGSAKQINERIVRFVINRAGHILSWYEN